ncbi:MAG: fatty acid desaturase [Amylibacter sp.]
MTTSNLRIKWPTLALIVATYAAWFGAGAVLYPLSATLALIAMAFINTLHSSLVHEIIHGHPTRNARINEALVFANPGLIWPFQRYRKMHLNHHADERLTDPFDDPESYYRAMYLYDGFPTWFKKLLGLSNTLIGRLILGPPLSTFALIMGDGAAILRGEKPVIRAWALHALGLIPIVFCITQIFQIPLWLYAITASYGGAAIISLRTFAEHQWHETPEGRTIVVERSPLSFLFLNNNLHLVHHQNTTVPWYNLPALYTQDRDKWHRLNDGYIYPNYWKLFRSYALIAKEPVVHPVWHRSKETE